MGLTEDDFEELLELDFEDEEDDDEEDDEEEELDDFLRFSFFFFSVSSDLDEASERER